MEQTSISLFSSEIPPDSPALRNRRKRHSLRSATAQPLARQRNQTRPCSPGKYGQAIQSRLLYAGMLLLILLTGCHYSGKKPVGLPAQHSIRADQMLLLSDLKLSKQHPLILDLVGLRQEVSQTLELPLQEQTVVIYLFSNELEYRQYLDANFPNLPPRRAYFVGTSQQLAVYTFWGERIQEDLRHEFTHGLLHSSLEDVPLWLDEGLAEYFELAGNAPGQINADYARQLAKAVENEWTPDLKRLEQLEEVAQMQRQDYQESWAWVHFMLHDSPETRHILLDYLQKLKTDSPTPPLSELLAQEIPQMQNRMLNYVASLRAPYFHPETASEAGRAQL